MAEISNEEKEEMNKSFSRAEELSKLKPDLEAITAKVKADDAATVELSRATSAEDFAADKKATELLEEAGAAYRTASQVTEDHPLYSRDEVGGGVQDEPQVVEARQREEGATKASDEYRRTNAGAIDRAYNVHDAALKENREVEAAAQDGINRQEAADDPAIRAEVRATDEAARISYNVRDSFRSPAEQYDYDMNRIADLESSLEYLKSRAEHARSIIDKATAPDGPVTTAKATLDEAHQRLVDRADKSDDQPK